MKWQDGFSAGRVCLNWYIYSLVMDAVEKYMEDKSSPEPAALQWVRKQTFLRTNYGRMLSGPVQGRLLSLLVKMLRPARILEIGTFTGYSTICLAEGLEPGGMVDTLEINDELEDLILEGFAMAGVNDRVNLLIGDAKLSLKSLSENRYDLVFMDANKREYSEYFDLFFDMVNPGGFIIADNVLWDGKVCVDPMPQDRQTRGIDDFNRKIKQDPRVESCIIPIRDGLNLIRKIG